MGRTRSPRQCLHQAAPDARPAAGAATAVEPAAADRAAAKPDSRRVALHGHG
ncbi:hypothetical protein [Streptomyces subrutilus]|uniref:hypothetical protein n=1 Tax=Streptomyces subrutilus TaxID=36818 RepID=UPI00142F1063|nr:hypothetical protein [Streptomyces subrutilus]WSJ28379.1 hypothetical protein OG479_03170 [Streptomyces subrutilus]